MKKNLVLLLSLMLVMALAVSGCGKKGGKIAFVVDTGDDNTVTIRADNAVKDSGATAYIEVKEGEVLFLEKTLFDEGEIRIDFFTPGENENPVFTYNVNDSGQAELDFGEGKYDLAVTVVKDVSGLVKLSSRVPEFDD